MSESDTGLNENINFSLDGLDSDVIGTEDEENIPDDSLEDEAFGCIPDDTLMEYGKEDLKMGSSFPDRKTAEKFMRGWMEQNFCSLIRVIC